MFLAAFSIRVSVLSSKIHNGDDTAKDSSAAHAYVVGGSTTN